MLFQQFDGETIHSLNDRLHAVMRVVVAAPFVFDVLAIEARIGVVACIVAVEAACTALECNVLCILDQSDGITFHLVKPLRGGAAWPCA